MHFRYHGLIKFGDSITFSQVCITNSPLGLILLIFLHSTITFRVNILTIYLKQFLDSYQKHRKYTFYVSLILINAYKDSNYINIQDECNISLLLWNPTEKKNTILYLQITIFILILTGSPLGPSKPIGPWNRAIQTTNHNLNQRRVNHWIYHIKGHM